MSKTRAKFTCTEVGKSLHWDRSKGFIYKAKFIAVTGKSEENEAFFAATPSGTIEISTMKEDQFEAGKDYYVDFSVAELVEA